MAPEDTPSISGCFCCMNTTFYFNFLDQLIQVLNLIPLLLACILHTRDLRHPLNLPPIQRFIQSLSNGLDCIGPNGLIHKAILLLPVVLIIEIEHRHQLMSIFHTLDYVEDRVLAARDQGYKFHEL